MAFKVGQYKKNLKDHKRKRFYYVNTVKEPQKIKVKQKNRFATYWQLLITSKNTYAYKSIKND